METLVEKKDIELVKPAKNTPNEVLSLSTMDSDYNLELLCQTLYVYQSNFSSETGKSCLKKDPSLIVKEALSRALVYYYPLAGKLNRITDNRRLQITCTAEGVPFLEATANSNLSSFNYFDGADVEIGKHFVFDCPSESQYGYHPLVIQVTKFSCGGFTIGMGLSHSVCDGYGAAQFFRTLTELASGKIEPTVKPVWERERLVGKPNQEKAFLHLIDKASLVTSPFLPATQLSHESFNIDDQTIKTLKNRLIKETQIKNQIPGENFTTLEVLGAYVWRSRYRALKQNPDGKALFCLAVGIRNAMNPPLNKGYYGNAFVSANVELFGRDLENWPISKIAGLIKESKKRGSTIEHIRNSLDLLETMRQQKMKIVENSGGGGALILTDWRQLRLVEEEDFGWKRCVNMIPLPWEMFGYVDLCIFMPPSRMMKTNGKEGGGVRVLVSLPTGAAMDRFKEEMDALKIQDYKNV